MIAPSFSTISAHPFLILSYIDTAVMHGGQESAPAQEYKVSEQSLHCL